MNVRWLITPVKIWILRVLASVARNRQDRGGPGARFRGMSSVLLRTSGSHNSRVAQWKHPRNTMGHRLVRRGTNLSSILVFPVSYLRENAHKFEQREQCHPPSREKITYLQCTLLARFRIYVGTFSQGVSEALLQLALSF